MPTGKTLAVVGGQYGSEGKGVIVAYLASSEYYDFGIHVRTGGPNAGHTFYHAGERHVMQTVPCGWIDPNAFVVIGAGGLVDVKTLAKEIDYVMQRDPSIRDRLIIDSQCGVISPHHQEEEGGTEGEMHQRIGSTGKGVGTARRDRVMRDPTRFKHIRDVMHEVGGDGWSLDEMVRDDVFIFLNQEREKGVHILLEGAQGSGLSLIHGPWPYATSADTNAAQLAADAGLPPQAISEVLLVFRTYPIRVAGNSGPLENELTWEEMSRLIGRQVQEYTTVTKKVRRIGAWDEDLVRRAQTLNGSRAMAITFLDYIDPASEGVNEVTKLGITGRRFVSYLEQAFGMHVALIGTGGDDLAVIDRKKQLWF